MELISLPAGRGIVPGSARGRLRRDPAGSAVLASSHNETTDRDLEQGAKRTARGSSRDVVPPPGDPGPRPARLACRWRLAGLPLGPGWPAAGACQAADRAAARRSDCPPGAAAAAVQLSQGRADSGRTNLPIMLVAPSRERRRYPARGVVGTGALAPGAAVALPSGEAATRIAHPGRRVLPPTRALAHHAVNRATRDRHPPQDGSGKSLAAWVAGEFWCRPAGTQRTQPRMLG
jgi:hypothetical protein